MVLSDDQWDELYTASIENRKDITWIRKGMDLHTAEIKDCYSRVNDLEINQGVQRGKVAFLAVSITTFLTLVTNGAFWLYSHAGGAK